MPRRVLEMHEGKALWRSRPTRYIRTRYGERQILTMPMSMYRFTRLTNGCGKKAANQIPSLAPHFMHDNSARKHPTLKVLPAMAAGITNKR
jgi:hypothetical protein